MLALVAYTGVGQSREAFTTSPELTTNGIKLVFLVQLIYCKGNI